MNKSPNPKVRNRFDRLHVPAQLAEAPEKALTQQQFKDECDINRIVKNAQRGIPPKYINRATPHYGDVSRFPDITEAYNIVQKAEESFMELPAQLRLELGNNPANFDKITPEQLKRFRLLKEEPTPSPAALAPDAPSADASKTPKGGPRKSSNDDV